MPPLHYTAPWWLPGGHLQTIWSALYARQRHAAHQPLQRERWDTPDGDFIDVDRLRASSPERPVMVMFHGLEGSSASHYAQACADWAAEHDVNWVMPHFRGCGGELNRGPRAYHSGDHAEIDWILKRLRGEHQALGGKVLVALGVWDGEWPPYASRLTIELFSSVPANLPAGDGGAPAHAAAGDPHTGYRLESADHSHASSGLQGGQVAGSDLSGTPGGELGGVLAAAVWTGDGEAIEVVDRAASFECSEDALARGRHIGDSRVDLARHEVWVVLLGKLAQRSRLRAEFSRTHRGGRALSLQADGVQG